MCPNNCNRNGRCVMGVCYCKNKVKVLKVNRILQEKIAVSKIVLIIVMEMDNVLMDNVNAKMVFQEYHATKKAV
jgi:hypothetical protein